MEEKVEKIDLMQYIDRYFRALIRFRVLLLSIIVVCAVGLCVKERLTFQTTYSSKGVFVTKMEDSDNLFGINQDEDNDNMVSTFTSLMTGSEMQKILMNELNVSIVPGSIRIQRVEDTNLLELIVTSDNAQDAYDVAVALLNNYRQVTSQVMSDVSIVILDQPLLAKAPDAEFNYLRSLILGAGIGFIISLLLALILALTRRKVLSSEEIKKILHLTTISKIPYIAGSKKHVGENGLLLSNPRIQYGFRQAFHEVRMKLEQEHKKEGHKAFMLTSTMPDEGKSTISVNIALSLAQKGHKVILVDLDLRNPSVIQTIPSNNSKATIVDYLKGKYRLDDAISHYDVYGLDVTYGVSSDEDAAQLLSSPRFEKMIEMLKERYDFIIMDAPPLYMMGDALLIAQHCDSAIAVIRQDYAGLYDVQDALEELNDYVPNMSGAILNQVHHSLFLEEDHPYGYGYGYGYGHGYGYGYGRNKKS